MIEYRPVLLCCADNEFKLSRKSDIWSLGCILYQMVYGRTPFHHIKNMIGKMRAITMDSHIIAFSTDQCTDPALIDTLKLTLERDFVKR